jgi:hypothetical protein
MRHGVSTLRIGDKQLAYVTMAKLLAAMVVDLLGEGARGAREVVAKSKPPMTREAYLASQRSITRREMYES